MSVVDDLYELDWKESPRICLTLDDGQSFEVSIVDAMQCNSRTRYGDGHLDYSIAFHGDVTNNGNLPSETGFIYYTQRRDRTDEGPRLVVWGSDTQSNHKEITVGNIEVVSPLDTEENNA